MLSRRAFVATTALALGGGTVAVAGRKLGLRHPAPVAAADREVRTVRLEAREVT